MNINTLVRMMSSNTSSKRINNNRIIADFLRAKTIKKSNSSTKSSPTTREILQGISDDITDKTFAFNHYEAGLSRDWEEMMSDTSHQREVADLKAAGLNPVLSANGGAASYTGATASGSAADPTSAIASIYDRKLANKNNISVTKLNTKNALKIAKLNYASTKYASDRGLQSAATSAAATRAAAGATAAATRAAAAESAAAQRYASDQNYAASKYNTDNSRNGTWPGVISSLGNKYSNSTQRKAIFGQLGSTGSNANIRNRVR